MESRPPRPSQVENAAMDYPSRPPTTSQAVNSPTDPWQPSVSQAVNHAMHYRSRPLRASHVENSGMEYPSRPPRASQAENFATESRQPRASQAEGYTMDYPRPPRASHVESSATDNPSRPPQPSQAIDFVRPRRPSTVAEVAMRGPKESMAAEILERASSSKRASYAAFLSTAPCHKDLVVEHVVLLKLKLDADPGDKRTLLDAMHELRNLDGVLELTIGAALSVQGGDFTHVLHGRYRDKAALEAYYAHADHVDIQSKLQSMTEDRLTVDWECVPYGPYIESIGAKRITLLKIKNKTSAEDMRFLAESIQLLPSKCPTVGQASAGANISPERSKGFTYAIMELFPSTEEEEEVFASCEHIAWQNTKIKPIAEALLLADYHARQHT